MTQLRCTPPLLARLGSMLDCSEALSTLPAGQAARDMQSSHAEGARVEASSGYVAEPPAPSVDEQRASHLERLRAFAPDAADEARARALDAALAATRLPSYHAGLPMLEHAIALLFEPEEVERILSECGAGGREPLPVGSPSAATVMATVIGQRL